MHILCTVSIDFMEIKRYKKDNNKILEFICDIQLDFVQINQY